MLTPASAQQALQRNMRLWRGLARAWVGLRRLRLRAADRAYKPDGAGYEGVQGRYEQRQRDQAEAREAKRRRVAGGSSA